MLTRTEVRTVARQSNGTLRLHCNGHDGHDAVLESDVLLAIGRDPNTDTLGLAATGVIVNPDGSLPTDPAIRTPISPAFMPSAMSPGTFR